MGLKIASLTTPTERAPQRLSLCMIMRDEEEHLARCLASVEGVVDEIVIVDTGSIDRSVEIAASFGARVLHEDWRGDFAAPRNTAIDAATGDWILVLDADEELVDGGRLRDLLHEEDMEGFCFREVNFIGEERGIESVVNSAFRLFRNRPRYRYSGALHEQIMGTVDPQGGVCTRFVGIEIHHYGYLEPTSRAKEKTDRNMAIVMEEVRRKPEDSFTLFNAGVEYQRVGRFDEALDYFSRSFAHLPTLKAYYASLLLRNIVATLNSLERWDEALDVLGDALQAYPDFTDLHYLQGQIHTSRREYRAAVRSFRRAIELGDHGGDRYLAQAGMGSFYSWHSLGVLHEMMGDLHEAVRCQRNAIRAAGGYYAAPVMRLTRLLLRGDPPAAVRDYMTGVVPEPRRAESLTAIARVLLLEGHAEHALATLAEARELSPSDPAIGLAMADALIRLGDLPGARALLVAVPPSSASRHLALAKTVLVGLVAGDADEVRAAVDELRPVADGVYAAAYEAALLAQSPDGPPPALPPGTDAEAALAAVLELAGTVLELGELDVFNALVPLAYSIAPRRSDVDRTLGHLLFENDFPDPAADRLIAAIQAGDETPEAFAALGRICQSKGMPDDAEAFMRAALEADGQNMSRHIDLAGLLAGAGRYAEADAVIREGLVVYPHSSVLRELRQSMSLLAGATG
ncbi:glycosyltransferase family 2 protein [Miltoncostaea marina]|uniref:glycosyltransferase family 2 protein n=1 Tax=Miltoncostaea marina TaxID=2843215 RepID=UPI001C3CDDBE|nr:glycosyltransferase family 2 protein [Miltoncostaea marina]